MKREQVLGKGTPVCVSQSSKKGGIVQAEIQLMPEKAT